MVKDHNNINEERKEVKTKEATSKIKVSIHQNYSLLKLIKSNYDSSTISPIERLISSELNISPKNEDIDYNSLKLIDFKINHINKLKEDIFYYSTSPQNLLNYKQFDPKEKYYEFYQDLENSNFISSQKERFDIILQKENTKNFIESNLINENIFDEIIFPEKINKNKITMKKTYLLCQLLNKYNFFELKDIDNNKFLTYLEEIKNTLIIENGISPYSCGITLYNSIVNNINLILEINSKKFKQKNENLFQLILILKDICSNISSIQLKLYQLKVIKQNMNILKDKDIHYNDQNTFLKSFINFNDINSGYKSKLVFLDLIIFLYNEDYKNEIDDVNNLIINENWTLNSRNYLYLFIKNPYKLKTNKKIQFLIYFQIDLEKNKIINYGKINLIGEDKIEIEKLIDINISIKEDIIYIVYIIKSNQDNIEKYYLKYKAYNINMINLDINNNKNIIEFSSFIPIRLINDSKYLYCFSKSEKIFIIKRNLNFDKYKYVKCKFNIHNFKMNNTFYINNYLILENIKENRKYSAIINKYNNEEYKIEIFGLEDEKQVENNKEQNIIFNLSYNDNKYIITKLNLKTYELYFNVIKNDKNNIYFFFPYSHCYLNYPVNDCYENYLKQICFILNLCCNNYTNNKIDLILSSIFHFRISDLKFIIEEIMKNKEYNTIQLYYIIILRTTIKYKLQLNELEEEEIKNIISFLKEIIIKGYSIEEKNIYHKILKEIIIICSYRI